MPDSPSNKAVVLSLVLLLVCGATANCMDEWRSWTYHWPNGKTTQFEAKFIAVKGESVLLEARDSKRYQPRLQAIGAQDRQYVSTLLSSAAAPAHITEALANVLHPDTADYNTVTLAVWFSSPVTNANVAQLTQLATVLANQQVVVLDLVSSEPAQRETLSKALSAHPKVVLLGARKDGGKIVRDRVLHEDAGRLSPQVDAIIFVGFLNTQAPSADTTTSANHSSASLNPSVLLAFEKGKDIYVFAGSREWDMQFTADDGTLHVGTVAKQQGRIAWYSQNPGGEELTSFIAAIRSRDPGTGQLTSER